MAKNYSIRRENPTPLSSFAICRLCNVVYHRSVSFGCLATGAVVVVGFTLSGFLFFSPYFFPVFFLNFSFFSSPHALGSLMKTQGVSVFFWRDERSIDGSFKVLTNIWPVRSRVRRYEPCQRHASCVALAHA